MASLAERAQLIEACRYDESIRSATLALCRRDPIFWFENFAFTFNPRVSPAHIPFNLYNFQHTVVDTLAECIITGESLIIEKSRDMGLTWIIMLTFQYFWMFHDGMDFLVGSRKEDLVDKKGDRSTLFEKLRYNLRYCPIWMCPKLRRDADSHMRMIHPETGNGILGESAVPDFGRGARYRAVLMDEFARQPYGQEAYDSISPTSDCIVMLWTPYGKANSAWKMRNNPDVTWVELPK